MKHYKSMEFLLIFRMSSPPQKHKVPYWKLSSDGSATFLYITFTIWDCVLMPWSETTQNNSACA